MQARDEPNGNVAAISGPRALKPLWRAHRVDDLYRRLLVGRQVIRLRPNDSPDRDDFLAQACANQVEDTLKNPCSFSRSAGEAES